MNYKILSNLTSWIFPTKETRKAYRALCKSIEEDKTVLVVQKRYKKILSRLKNKKGKIRVLFLISENSKWKAQALYDLMAQSNKFEPIIALTLMTEVHKGEDITRNNLEQDFKFFSSKGMNVVYAYKNGDYVNLKNFNADIVFYQQPWDISKKQFPEVVSKFALTYYIPYYVNNYELQPIEYDQFFHKLIYKYFVLNKWWEEQYKQKTTLTNVLGLGNPILDSFISKNKMNNDKKYVIYAPHYSVYHTKNINPVNYGTFLLNGKFILEFAKQHKNLNWVFKPHPQLKYSLLKIGFNINEIEEYYKAWEQIGECCYDSSYVDYFKDSKLLITDSDSFLLEYFCTQKPIIHLISSNCKINVSEFSKPIFETFYKVTNKEELIHSLNSILIDNNDPKKSERQIVLNNSNLLSDLASEKILQNIYEDLEIEVKK